MFTFFSSWRWASLLASFLTCSKAALLADLIAVLVLSPSCLIILPIAFTVSAFGLLWTHAGIDVQDHGHFPRLLCKHMSV